ncbi:GPI inositol-deacylase [Phanerochaete sordida]|uniref:GPI inositol-deacylase n=1 Tax=Phanerochaete sordida TaxID=48140 RepID=A0A9P3FYA9_9APHY|nr:GPI inositol-deacylase [Phanerochaete sordida]
MTSRLPVYLISVVSLCVVAALYYASIDTIKTLSPQGCRMSWMSPSYLLQSGFDRKWTSLAGRYSLWLYREVGWEGHELHGAPVLFIPGNAGSSHQVRSIASSAARQYYSNPHEVAFEFRGNPLKALDFFAVEFNEDLSAFHGTTLDAQKAYTRRAIDYILSLYPPDTPIVIMGHSMGGVVGVSLLPHPKVSAIITMSTPHTLPPARFDRRVDRIYSTNRNALLTEPTPILSMCGGATDLMIPSESCILPEALSTGNGSKPYRRTIFSSALEGSWTGVGHREMVWCHQVRWRIARAALQLGPASTASGRADVLDTWLRDGQTLPPGYTPAIAPLALEGAEYLSPDVRLELKNPTGSRTYVMPAPGDTSSRRRFLLYVSQGSISPTAPHSPLPLRASIYACSTTSTCQPLRADSLRLVPNPQPGKPFPVPDEGSDESEGVVVFEAELPSDYSGVAVRTEYGDGRGWVVGGFVPEEPSVDKAGALGPLLSHLSLVLPSSQLRTTVQLPNLLSSALLVYSLAPKLSDGCTDALLWPLLQYTSHPAETHYFPLGPRSRILLHTHASAPFISSAYTHGLNFSVYSTGESACAIERLELAVDLWATLGRWGTRYAAPAASWAVGVVAISLFDAWRAVDAVGVMPSVGSSLATFASARLPILLILSFLTSFIPLLVDMWLGNRGEWQLSPIAPLLLLTVTGLVSVSWAVISILMWPLRKLARRFFSRSSPVISRRTSSLVSLGLICLLIFLLVPWQVGFLGCWIYHLSTCASVQPTLAVTENAAIPLIPRDGEDEQSTVSPIAPSTRLPATTQDRSAQNEREHLLLLMTWLLPLAAPVLAIWVRTLFTAGLTTPFDGDHNVLYVAPFLVLVDPSWGLTWTWVWGGPAGLKSRWTMVVLALAAFVWGPRYTYLVFEVASAMLVVGVVAHFIKR